MRGHLAKRVNYGFGKRQKEIKRQQKREEKAAKRRMKKEATGEGDQSGMTPEAGDPSAEIGERTAEADGTTEDGR